ncbi:MAG: VOC family protein [Gemmatimonadota bacterium]|nr:VOC family protein [Gemmatimonadota bacterium]MXW05136.1 VOC family protein [Gemmatimonadota bacterium]MYB61095.1 VOC family protein [Gemmatimonadota bacterium]
MKLVPYLAFNGQCEEALEFYRDCLGGSVVNLSHYSKDQDIGMEIPDHMVGKAMHMSIQFGENMLMGSDHIETVPSDTNISLSIDFTSVDEQEQAFNAMSAGGEVTMPLQDTFWGSRFGMITDKFGINWMFNCHLNTPEQSS